MKQLKYKNSEEFVAYIEKTYLKGENMASGNVVYTNISALLDTITRTGALFHNDNVEKLNEDNVDKANDVIGLALDRLKDNINSLEQ